MNTKEMLEEVDRRVSENFLEHLLPAAINRHVLQSRKNHRECDCSYCNTKKEASYFIGNVSYPKDYVLTDEDRVSLEQISAYPTYYLEYKPDVYYLKKMRRAKLRQFYRAKLKALKE
jgi:hypothetical protein